MISLISRCTLVFTHTLIQIAGYGYVCYPKRPSVCGNTLHQPQPGPPSGSQVHRKAYAKNKQTNSTTVTT